MSRTKNGIMNISYAMVSQLFLMLTQFIARRLFIDYLGIEYLGITGLFTNIISVLSFAELGVGTAIIFSLYKSVAANDDYQTAALLNFYKKIYLIIMLGITVAGIGLFPFLDFFIKDKPDIQHLNYYYFFFLAATVLSYASVYKSSIVIASQKEYVITSFAFIASMAINVVQILIIITTRNYAIFLSVNLIGVILNNFYIARYVNAHYHNVINKNYPLDNETKLEISKNTKGMIFQKVGGVMVDSTDNILISSFIGLSSLGLYSNYYMIILAFRKIVSQIFKPLTAIIGNLCATENKERTFEVFETMNFLNFWAVSFLGIGIFICINPLVELWLGINYLLTYEIVLLITLNFYLKSTRETIIVFKNANGLYWEERYKGIAEATVNLIASLVFIHIFGFMGVLMGTTFSTITTVLWIEPLVLYKNYFKEFSLFEYAIKSFYRFILFIIMALISFIINDFLFIETGIMSLIGRIILCTIIVNATYFFIFSSSKEFKYFLEVIDTYRNKGK